MSFNPYQLTPNASINRVKLITVSGLSAEKRRETVYNLLGRDALAENIKSHFPELSRRGDVIPVFDNYIGEKRPDALKLADEFGNYLANLLLLLKNGHPEDRAARPEWTDAHWAHWAGVEQIIFGGGLMRGHLGAHVVGFVQPKLNGAYRLSVSTHPIILPLIGAARHASANAEKMLVFDFGGTAVKRGLAHYQNGILVDLQPIDSLPTPQASNPAAFARQIIQCICDTYRTVGQGIAPHMVISMANYIQGRQPVPDWLYGILNSVSVDVTGYLADAISIELQTPVTLKLIHDGTAAAHAYAGLPNAAVIMMGTALGVGFPPPSADLRPCQIML